MTVITHLPEDVGLKQNDDVTHKFKTSHIFMNSTDLCKLMNVISETVDPFPLHTEKEFLVNIATGKSASAETIDFLLDASRTGCDFQKEFIDECVADPSRYEKPIKRQKVWTFSSEGAKVKKKLTDENGKKFVW